MADAASTAREYITDKASVVGDKLQGLKDVDYAEYANQAKDYARQNPGQALPRRARPRASSSASSSAAGAGSSEVLGVGSGCCSG